MTSFDRDLASLQEDSITIEPFASQDVDLKLTYGAGVSYPAFVYLDERRMLDAEGRDFESFARAIIAGRVTVDKRSRVTLPAGFVPQQPPIRAIVAQKAIGLDHTILIFGNTTGGFAQA